MKMYFSASLLIVAVMFQPEVTAMFVREPRAFRVNSYERLPYKRSYSDKRQRFASGDFPLRLKIEDREEDKAAQKIIELFLNEGLLAEDYTSSKTDVSLLVDTTHLSPVKRRAE